MKQTTTILIVLAVLITAIALTSLSNSSVSESETREEPLNVIIIGADYVRADHMPCYGYERNTTPNLCKFAENNTKFTNAFSQAGWTHPAVGTLFTSQYPEVHGMKETYTSLNNSSTTLAEYLNEKGYKTTAFPGLSPVAAKSNDSSIEYQLLPKYNLKQGFENYHSKKPFLPANTNSANKWLRDQNDNNFFLYVQGFDPINYKMPSFYTRPHKDRFDPEYDGVLHNREVMTQTKPLSVSVYRQDNKTLLELENGTKIRLSQRDIEHVIAHYDHQLYEADKHIGRLLDSIRQKDLMNETVIVFQSSHGVYLNDPVEHSININGKGQRVFGHAGISNAETHVPLIIHAPETSNKKIERSVGSIDVMPTVLHLANIPVSQKLENEMQGQILPPFSDKYSKKFVFSVGGWGMDSVQSSKWKLIMRGGYSESLVNLRAGKGSLRPSYRQDVTQNLVSEYDEWNLENHRLNSKIK